MDIENELKKFNVTDAAIAELAQNFLILSIDGIDDKEGKNSVSSARKIVKGYRVDVDKRRKELNADALEYQRRINGEAKRITALLEPIENHLENEEKKISDELEKIAKEKQDIIEARYADRIAKLIEIGFKFTGKIFCADYHDKFTSNSFDVTSDELMNWEENTFSFFYENASGNYISYKKEVEEKKLAEEEQKRLLDKQRQEQEIEAKRLEDLAKTLEEKEAKQSLKWLFEKDHSEAANFIAESIDEFLINNADNKPGLVLRQGISEDDFYCGANFVIDAIENVLENRINSNVIIEVIEEALAKYGLSIGDVRKKIQNIDMNKFGEFSPEELFNF